MNRRKLVLVAAFVATVAMPILAASLYTYTVPASVTINLPASFQLLDATCTTPVTSVSFPAVSAGSSTSAAYCLKNNGGADQWVTSSSISSTLPSTEGTLTTTFGTFTLPLEFKPTNTSPVTFTLATLSTATTGPLSFSISIVAYSSSTG